MNSKQLGIFLRKKRQKKGLTQKAIAEKLGFATAQFVSNIERGLAELPLTRVDAYSEILELDGMELKQMLGKALLDKVQRKTNKKIYGKTQSSFDDPFLVKFIEAWHSASTKDKESVQVLVSRFLNIDVDQK